MEGGYGNYGKSGHPCCADCKKDGGSMFYLKWIDWLHGATGTTFYQR